jgi:uncharacterized protein (TIGR02145 family)
MKSKFVLATVLTLSTIIAFGQRPTMELTFTAVNNIDWVQLDSIKVMNRTQGGDTVLYYPDTVLVLDFQVGVPEVNMDTDGFQVFQNYPNPVTNRTTISMYVPEKGSVGMVVMDVLGRMILKMDRTLDKGTHSFSLIPGSGGLIFFTAQWKRNVSSIKILNAVGSENLATYLEYVGNPEQTPQLKAEKALLGGLPYSQGDGLLYVGYIDTLESGILDTPDTSNTYTFQLATNIPCPGTPTVEYEGQVYNTIQIFSQCWLKENLNVGTMIQGSEEMTDNGVMEKFCFNNEADSCVKYGGLYQWGEMMQYNAQQSLQGMCPSGWHIPSDEEWKVLEGAVDSQYGIGNSIWDNNGPNRGYDAGVNLKDSDGWHSILGTDLFGFSALPGGFRRNYDSVFLLAGYRGEWWSSTRNSTYASWKRYMQDQTQQVGRFFDVDEFGFSVRCILDEVYTPVIELTFTAINNAIHVQLDSIKVMNRTQGGETVIVYPDTTLTLPNELAFNIGDELLSIGYTDTLESGILDIPEESQTYTFQFATNIPCPGTPMVEYEGKVYNTIQVFSQCWMKENLNVGERINGIMEQSNNETIEKYCYNNEPDSCTKYGGLYQWNEMMQYTEESGVQGICPPGWHLPTDEEWKLLEGAVDSQYGIGDPEWDLYWECRGYDAGTNLKTSSGWVGNGNGSDLFGFTGLPGGYRHYSGWGGYFQKVGGNGKWWTSTVLRFSFENAWYHDLYKFYPEVGRYHDDMDYGFSVRCLRDEEYIPTFELTFTAINNTTHMQLDSIKVMNRTQEDEVMLYGSDTTLFLSVEMLFTPGDELLYIGYADTLQSGMLDSPEESATYTFQFATNIPCLGTPIVEYEGQIYNTIQIYSQCWLKENLNVGTMIQGNEEMADNGIIEKYCYNNQPDSCTKYGGLYQWDEMMQYTTQQGVQGICPPGWYLPTDEEWKVLEGAVDSQYGIGDPEWDSSFVRRGYDAGMNLKTISGWNIGDNGTDLFGFSGLPGGGRHDGGSFLAVRIDGTWWTSTECGYYCSWTRDLTEDPEVDRDDRSMDLGFSVRCLRDE